MRLLFLMMVMCVLGTSVYAGSYFRCDLNGKPKGVKLSPVEKEGELKVVPQSWLKEEDRVFAITAPSAKLGNEWQSVKFSFKPENSGEIFISFMGQWNKDVEKRSWVLVKDITINGKGVSNSDFKEIADRNGKAIPVGFNLGVKARIVEEDGVKAALVNHDNRLTHSLKVEAGTDYTIELKVKPGTPPSGKKINP